MEERHIEEEELSLYEILEIVLKYKKQVIKILVIGFVLSFGLAVGLKDYNRKELGKQEFSVNYDQFDKKLEYYEINGISYKKFNPQIIVQSEEYIDKFLEIKELKESFSKIKVTPINRVEEKVKFISKRIKVEQDKEKPENYKLSIIALKKANITEKIAEIYFKILNNEVVGKLDSIVKKEQSNSIKLNKEISTKLEEIKKQTVVLAEKEARKTNTSAENLDYLVKMKEPLLMSEKDFQQSLYERTSKEISGIDQIIASKTLDNIIQKNSSLIITDKDGLAKKILLAGVVFSFLIAIGYVMFKEFVINYEKYRKEILIVK